MSFSESEVNAFNKLYFPKHILKVDEVDSLNIIMKEIRKLLSKRINYYQMDLPDALNRYLIYKLTDINSGEEFYFMEGASVWGEALMEKGTFQWQLN